MGDFAEKIATEFIRGALEFYIKTEIGLKSWQHTVSKDYKGKT